MSATLLFFTLSEFSSHSIRYSIFGLLIVFTALAYVVANFSRLRWPTGKPRFTAESFYRISLTPRLLRMSYDGFEVEYSWDQLHALEETDSHILLYISPTRGYIIPNAAFSSPEQISDFINSLRNYWTAEPENFGRTLSDHPDFNYLLKRFFQDLRANFVAALRTVFLRPVVAIAFRANATQLTLLIILDIATGIGIQFISAFPQPQFDSYSLPIYGVDIFLFLFGSVIVARLLGNGRGSMRFLVIICATSIVLAIPVATVILMTQIWPSQAGTWVAWGIGLLSLVWIVIAAFRAIMILYRPSFPRAIFVTSLYTLLNFTVMLTLPEARLFYAQVNEPDQAQSTLNIEDVFYAQANLLRVATAALKPERPGIADLYFVGFAGEAREAVFSNEVTYVREQFDAQFDTAGRSLALVNKIESVATSPIASVNNLRGALLDVGAKMNKEEDILFLFLTSHGSRQHTLSVEFWPLELNSLPASQLKALLDESGIVNRVIVVSACFSGGFIDALKDDHSLIITAAAHDKTSFGCGTQSKFTYFGEAYFKDALHEDTSFIKAFLRAKSSIEKRELREGIEASNPQIYVGAKIEAALTQLQQ